jgi:hypothetical protein
MFFYVITSDVDCLLLYSRLTALYIADGESLLRIIRHLYSVTHPPSVEKAAQYTLHDLVLCLYRFIIVLLNKCNISVVSMPWYEIYWQKMPVSDNFEP